MLYPFRISYTATPFFAGFDEPIEHDNVYIRSWVEIKKNVAVYEIRGVSVLYPLRISDTATPFLADPPEAMSSFPFIVCLIKMNILDWKAVKSAQWPLEWLPVTPGNCRGPLDGLDGFPITSVHLHVAIQ